MTAEKQAPPSGASDGAAHNPGAASSKPRAHAMSWRHHLVLAAIVLVALHPLSRIRETGRAGARGTVVPS